MLRRTLLSLSLLVGIALSVPGLALAHGPVPRGLEVDKNQTVKGVVGQQSAEWQWYTVGLRPGTVKVNLTLKGVNLPNTPTYGLQVFLMEAATSNGLVHKQIGCASADKACNRSISFSYPISVKGPYYIVVQGLGGRSVKFSIKIQGSIYPLLCKKYC
jgi:hypothetical protein